MVSWSCGGVERWILGSCSAGSPGAGPKGRSGPGGRHRSWRFDVLQAEGIDLRSHPLSVRRAALETLLNDMRPPIQLVPQTPEVDEAREWLTQYTDSPVGIEGLVIKGRSSRYIPGKREWLKLRIRDTVEAIVAGVTGSVSAPERLVLALHDAAGELAFADTTGELNAKQRTEVAQLLEEPSAAAAHPWPAEYAERGIGRWVERRTYTLPAGASHPCRGDLRGHRRRPGTVASRHDIRSGTPGFEPS